MVAQGAISVLVAATDNIVRAGLLALVSAHLELTVVGSAIGTDTLTALVEELQPDVVLLELELDDDQSIAEKLLLLGLVQQVSAVVILVNAPQSEWTIEAIRSGVQAVLPRRAEDEEIVAAILAARAGLIVLHPDVVDSLVGFPPLVVRELPDLPLVALTPREIEVLNMMAEGLGNKFIARRLGISEHTVKFHVSSIFTKLNAKSRTEAVTLGARQGLIML